MGTVMFCPNIEWMVTVGLGDGPLPVVVTDTRQRAPVPVVEAVTVMVLPVRREVVPARSQV